MPKRENREESSFSDHKEREKPRTKREKREKIAQDEITEENTKQWAVKSLTSLKGQNKIVRSQNAAKILRAQKRAKGKERRKRQKLHEKDPENNPKQKPRTIEDKREHDDTINMEYDEEVYNDEKLDKLSDYFFQSRPENETAEKKKKKKKATETMSDESDDEDQSETSEENDDEANKEKTPKKDIDSAPREIQPKLLITSCKFPSNRCKDFIMDLGKVIPNSHYYPRRNYTVKEIVSYCKNRDFTNVMVINEDREGKHETYTARGGINGMLLIHLPDGPTAQFKLSNIELSKDIKGRAGFSSHAPEVLLMNFTTRLGLSVSKLLLSLFNAHRPDFKGRRVMTFKNMRDFIFFRSHRYIFDDEKTARLQETGPRFTMKLEYLQNDTFNTKSGEYEWIYKPEMATSKYKFFL